MFGVGPAVRIRLYNPRDLLWLGSYANTQEFTTIGAGLPSARFALRQSLLGAAPPTNDWSSEFRIRYNDAAGLREYADKWRLA